MSRTGSAAKILYTAPAVGGGRTKRHTVLQASRARARRKEAPATHSHWHLEIRDRRGRLKYRDVGWRTNLTTDAASGYTNRRDWESKALGGGPNMFYGASASGNATATTGTTLTNSGASFPTAGQALAGSVVFAGPNSSGAGSIAFGVIVSNSGTVLTIDQWYNPGTGAAATTPNATCSYCVLTCGQFPAPYMAVSATVFSPANTDTTLNGELTSNGFTRALGTYAHTAAASTYTLSHTWTATGTETITNEAQFGAVNTTAGGVMPFESAEPNSPTLVSGDTLQNTATITIG
jgi:hypothetical protein